MRVLLITDNYLANGGAELYFFALKKRLQALANIEVLAIGFANKAQQPPDAILYKACSSNIAKLFWRFFIQPILYWRMRKAIRAFNPDIIHLHNIKQYTATIMLAIRHYPVIQTVHDYSLLCPIGYHVHQDYQPCPSGFSWTCFWQHKLATPTFTYLLRVLALWNMQRQIKHCTAKLIAPSPHLRDDLQRAGFTDVIYIPPFLQIANYQSFTKANSNVFLFAGNLGEHKGVYLLLKEFALACHQKSQLKLMIVGSGPEFIKMRMLAEELSIDQQVQFLGWQTDLTPYYQSACALLFSSICIESFGMVVTEAMSHGRVVVGCDRGPTAWLIENDKTGLLFNPALKGDLARKILLLANNPALAEQLGKNAHHKMQSFIDNERSLLDVVKLYHEVSREGGR